MIDFSKEQLERYHRNMAIKELGVEGQRRIMNGKVMVAGVGGLGSPASFYLAAAGVGTLGLVDSDRVELSNLQRQIIHFTKDIHKLKVTSAAEKIKALNPDVTVKPCQELLRPENIRQIIKGYDVIIDGTDNFTAKFLLNDACIMENIPLVHGGVLRFNGQIMTIIPGKSACLRCILEKPSPRSGLPTAAEAGILGATAGVLGTLQATEAIKLLTGAGNLLTNAMLFFNTMTMTFTKQTFQKNAACALCGDHPTLLSLSNNHIG